MSAIACAPSGPGPKTVVDNVARADGSSTNDATPAGETAKPAEAPVTDVEPVGMPIDGSDLVEAKASVMVNAPIDKARTIVLKFDDYPQFMPEYSDCKVLGKLPSGNNKVYMEITTLGGVAKMYANVEILAAVKEGASETHAGKFIDGNVKQFKAVWTLTKTDETHTEVGLLVFLQPNIPLPDFLVNKANLDGAKKGVLAMKRRIEAAK
jgi:ribosome-associated toxin RatA of RatAB toxin-antitoxin module